MLFNVDVYADGCEEVRELMDRALSSKELLAYRKPRNKELPPRGFKEYAPDGSWVQGKRLEKALENTRDAVSEAKVNTCGSLIKGVWLPEQSLIEVVKGRGPFWRYMGYSEMKKDYLLPEEALFLMDSGTLEVMFGGIPLSIQQAYTKFLQALTITEYQVYAHLMRQGYIVTRYIPGSDTKISKYEKKIGLDCHIRKKKGKQQKKIAVETVVQEDSRKRSIETDAADQFLIASKRSREAGVMESCQPPSSDEEVSNENVSDQDITGVSSPTMETTEYIQSDTNIEGATCSNPEYVVKMDIEMPTSVDKTVLESGDAQILSGVQDIHESANAKECDSKKVGPSFDLPEFDDPALLVNDTKHSKEWCEKLPYTTWNFSDFAFLNISDQNNEFEKPDPSLLPENVILEESSYHPQTFGLTDDSQLGNLGENASRELEFSFGDVWNRTTPKRSSATNWCEYKQERLKETKEDNDIQSSVVSHLWQSDVTPLVRPEDAKTTAAILEKLQVIKVWNSDEKCSSYNPADGLRLAFNLYSPEMKSIYRKSAPPVPSFRVCVLRQSSSPPDLAMIDHMGRKTQDGVPILWAVSDFGDVQFFTFSPVEMPVDINP